MANVEEPGANAVSYPGAITKSRNEDVDIVIGTASDVKLLPAWIEAKATAPDAINRGKIE